MIFTAVLMLTACATNSDIEGLQTQLDTISKTQSSITADLSNTKLSLATSNAQANAALSHSEKALASLKDINDKLDKLFLSSQLK